MKKHLLLFTGFLILNSCGFELDDFKIAKSNLKRNNYEKAKKQFQTAIEKNHPKADSATIFIQIIDSLMLDVEIKKNQTKYRLLLENGNAAYESLVTQSKEPIPEEINSILIEVSLFKKQAERINQLDKVDSLAAKKLSKKLKSLLLNTQAKRLPTLRKNYAEALSKKLWERNIYVRPGNSGYRTINITGGTFANNANIKQFQTTIQPTLIDLRFKQARYRWYKKASEYTYYDMDPSDDRQLYTTK